MPHAFGVLSLFFPSHSAQDLHIWMRVIQGFHWVIERLDFVQDKRGQKVLCLGEEAPQCANTEAKEQCGSCTIRMSKLEVQKKQPCSAFNAWILFSRGTTVFARITVVWLVSWGHGATRAVYEACRCLWACGALFGVLFDFERFKRPSPPLIISWLACKTL